MVTRLALVKKKRPLLKDKRPDELESYIRTQIAEREFYYSQADYVVDADRVSADTILSFLPGLPDPPTNP